MNKNWSSISTIIKSFLYKNDDFYFNKTKVKKNNCIKNISIWQAIVFQKKNSGKVFFLLKGQLLESDQDSRFLNSYCSKKVMIIDQVLSWLVELTWIHSKLSFKKENVDLGDKYFKFEKLKLDIETRS